MKPLFAILLVLWLCIAPCRAATDPFDPFNAARIDAKPGAPIPLDLALRDQHGLPTTLRKIARNRVLVLVPVLHECPNICGVTLGGIVDAAKAQPRFKPGRDFALVAFGIDPKEGPEDAAAELRRLAGQRGDTGFPIFATTGSEAAVRAVTDALGYHYAWDARIGQYAHAAATAVLTPDGRLTRWLYGIAPEPDELGKAVADARAGRTGGFLRQLILLCYHYDPATGTYSLLIARVVRYAGIATVLGLAGLLFFLRRRWA